MACLGDVSCARRQVAVWVSRRQCDCREVLTTTTTIRRAPCACDAAWTTARGYCARCAAAWHQQYNTVTHTITESQNHFALCKRLRQQSPPTLGVGPIRYSLLVLVVELEVLFLNVLSAFALQQVSRQLVSLAPLLQNTRRVVTSSEHASLEDTHTSVHTVSYDALNARISGERTHL